MANTYGSFLSLADHENELPRESRWMVEAELLPFTFNAKERDGFYDKVSEI